MAGIELAPPELFEQNIALIERVVQRTARWQGFPPDQTDEFAGWVWLRLIDNDYACLRRFRSRSSLATYLSSVVGNLARDFRTHQWGKWRPSAEANRLGPFAVELERLMHRDEFGFEAAVEVLVQRWGSRVSRAELDGIAGKLPIRRRSGRHDHYELVDDLEATGGVERPLRNATRARIAGRIETALLRALEQLPAQDREIVRRRFLEGQTVVSIARDLRLDQRRLYVRIQRCLSLIRSSLEEHGLCREDLREIVAWPESEITLSGLPR